MKKPRKSKIGNKCHKKESVQALLPAEKKPREGKSNLVKREQKTTEAGPTASRLSEHSSQQQKEAHRKQKQWDQKHAELHARWQAAQRKQEEQEKADRKRAALIAYCMAGLIIAMIICVFLWYA